MGPLTYHESVVANEILHCRETGLQVVCRDPSSQIDSRRTGFTYHICVATSTEVLSTFEIRVAVSPWCRVPVLLTPATYHRRKPCSSALSVGCISRIMQAFLAE